MSTDAKRNYANEAAARSRYNPARNESLRNAASAKSAKPDFSYFPKPGYTFWLYDPEGDMTFWPTAEARDAAAADAIDESKDIDGSWSEEVEGICAGVVTHTAQCRDKVMRPTADGLDAEGCDGEGVYWGDFEWMGNYTLEPIEQAHQGEKE